MTAGVAPLPTSWKSLVERYLSLNLYDSARFYAERLYYDSPNEESLGLLATCYYRLGKVKQTYMILSESKYLNSPDNKYLFALVCLSLGKYDEAEFVLHSNNRFINYEEMTKENMASIPGGGAGLYLMGKICRRQQRKEASIHYFKLALQMDPFLWNAIVELSEIGVDMKIDELILNYRESSSQSSSPRVTRGTTKKPLATGGPLFASAEAKDYDCQSAKATLAKAAESLQSHQPTPFSTAKSADYSSFFSNCKMPPFATPSSLPSPIAQSMLSIGGMGKHQGDDPMLTSPLPGYSVGQFLHPETSQHTANSTIHFSRQSAMSADINPTRGTLFGLPTPATEQESDFRDISAIPQQHSSLGGDFEAAERSTLMELNSAFQKTGQDRDRTERRRVSFGPTARLSFSGAFDSHLPNPADSFAESSKVVTAEDDHPYKFIRSDTKKSVSHHNQLPPSPFPLPPTSPIRTHQDGTANKTLILEDPAHSPRYETSLTYDDSLADAKTGYSLPPHPPRTAEVQPLPPSSPPAGPVPTSPSRSTQPQGQGQRAAATSSSSSSVSGQSQSADVEQILAIVANFARALQQLYSYFCVECIETLQRLPERHFQSALVSQIIGKACTEMNEYKGATVAFREMRRLEPFRVHGIEVFSSALWHLREDKELSALAQQAVDIDKYAPETWCVVGNCFSLQKETDMAIKFFQRALQIDPFFTYAYTLCGHEHVNNEDMEKAITSFRTAVLCNERHYNAWYGLGSIYYRQERFEMSEYHFRRARSINPRSSVLDCYLGMALNAQGSVGKIFEALEVLSDASQRDPQNPQLRFQRAHILFGQDRLDEALEELLLVEQFAPKEPPVHAMLGQIYQRMGRTQEALLHLNVAMDLDPKESNAIKAIMDNFDEPQLTA